MSEGGRCYACFRPMEICFCDLIPTIDNRTEVLILQHRRERFHRFNTARIVHHALSNSQLLVDHIRNLAERLKLKPRAGLLYPGPGAISLVDLPRDRRPQQLVVLDGTWHQTKTLLRDIPALQGLPRYQLAPATPSRYRIRQEPQELFISTVEATAAALRLLEPETAGLDQLLQAFERMVNVQLAHPGSANGARFVARGSRTVKNVPLALHGDLANVVVAYGEGMPGVRGAGKRAPAPPICWVARRLGDDADFGCLIEPSQPLSDVFLGHLELRRSDFATALLLAEARQRWAEFARPDDIVMVIQPGTAQLFSYIADKRCLVLKAVDIKTPSELVTENPIATAAPTFGRASQRLEMAIAFVQQLNAFLKSRRASLSSSNSPNSMVAMD